MKQASDEEAYPRSGELSVGCCSRLPIRAHVQERGTSCGRGRRVWSLTLHAYLCIDAFIGSRKQASDEEAYPRSGELSVGCCSRLPIRAHFQERGTSCGRVRRVCSLKLHAYLCIDAFIAPYEASERRRGVP